MHFELLLNLKLEALRRQTHVSTTMRRKSVCFSVLRQGEFVFSSKIWTIFTLGRKTHEGYNTVEDKIDISKKYIYM